MSDKQIKKVIVVLSAGRSGTSLLMNALGQLGMNLSENMIPAGLENPEGFFEDIDIVQIHKQLFSDLKTKPTLPLPADWQKSGATREARQKLSAIIIDRLETATSIWGFKDPRICSFLPLWTTVFNSANVVPIFILAIRAPASVASSLRRQINREESITELQWLQRTCDAIYHTAADCFIAHYEEWFTHPGDLGRRLLDYTGVSEFSGSIDLDAVIKGLIKPNLNRAQYEDYSVQNQWVAKLYAQLQQCHGSNFDRKALLNVVKDCRSVMAQFKGWADAANEHGEPVADQKELETELKKAVSENNNLLQQTKDLFEEVSDLRRQIGSLSSENRPVEITEEKTIPGNTSLPQRSANRPGEITKAKTIPRNTSIPQRKGLIVFAKQRVANLLPGVYRYYREIIRRS